MQWLYSLIFYVTLLPSIGIVWIARHFHCLGKTARSSGSVMLARSCFALSGIVGTFSIFVSIWTIAHVIEFAGADLENIWVFLLTTPSMIFLHAVSVVTADCSKQQ